MIALFGLLACTTTTTVFVPAQDSATNGPHDQGPGGNSNNGQGNPFVDISGHRAPTHVLMISIDTVRRDRVGRYASGVSNTPTLDSLMSDGAVLDAHHSCSNWTYASSLCALTGQSTVDMQFIPNSITAVGSPATTLAEALGDVGYTTGLVSANPWVCGDFAGEGYDREECLQAAKAATVIDTSLDMLGDMTDGDPWFFHLHLMDPHWTYEPPAAYTTGSSSLPSIPYDVNDVSGLMQLDADWAYLDDAEQADVLEVIDFYYGAELRYTDDEIARLLDELDTAGMLDDTIVVLWTDHGEQFLDHDSFGHSHALFQEENLALAAFWAPGLIEPGVWSSPTSHRDIVPTLLQVLGQPIPDGVKGRIVGLDAPDAPVFAHMYDNDHAEVVITEGTHRLFYDWDGNKALYDVGTDPSELEDLYISTPNKVDTLWQSLLPEVERMESLVGRSGSDVGP